MVVDVFDWVVPLGLRAKAEQAEASARERVMLSFMVQAIEQLVVGSFT